MPGIQFTEKYLRIVDLKIVQAIQWSGACFTTILFTSGLSSSDVGPGHYFSRNWLNPRVNFHFPFGPQI